MSLETNPPSLYPVGLSSSSPPVVTADLQGSVDEALEMVHKATKGFGTDEKKLIQALASQNPTSRYHMATRYPQVYGGKKETSLVELIDSECGDRREYAVALKWLAMAPHQAEAAMIEMGTKVRHKIKEPSNALHRGLPCVWSHAPPVRFLFLVQNKYKFFTTQSPRSP